MDIYLRKWRTICLVTKITITSNEADMMPVAVEIELIQSGQSFHINHFLKRGLVNKIQLLEVKVDHLQGQDFRWIKYFNIFCPKFRLKNTFSTNLSNIKSREQRSSHQYDAFWHCSLKHLLYYVNIAWLVVPFNKYFGMRRLGKFNWVFSFLSLLQNLVIS